MGIDFTYHIIELFKVSILVVWGIFIHRVCNHQHSHLKTFSSPQKEPCALEKPSCTPSSPYCHPPALGDH